MEEVLLSAVPHKVACFPTKGPPPDGNGALRAEKTPAEGVQQSRLAGPWRELRLD